MKVSKVYTHNRVDIAKVSTYGIKSYGAKNDYPQKIRELLNSSVTGSSCATIYKSFINGLGFVQQDAINGQDMNDILPLVASDLAEYGGFALAINWNANYKVASIYHIPFEHVRLSLDESGVKLHPDWGHRYTSVKNWSADDIVSLPFYDARPEVIEEQVELAGGWQYYKGQCLYYSNKGHKVYPLPIFDAALVDMSTEEAISDITHRNARNGFLPAGLLVDSSADSDVEAEDTEKYIKAMQGSEFSCKIGYVRVKDESEVPHFVPFNGTNYDKDFSVSREAVKDSIGRAFNQPAILRSENVGAGFGADLMKNAYQYYNNVVSVQRDVITRCFSKLYPDYDFSITPLQYGDGVENKDKVLEIVLNNTIDVEQKKRILSSLYRMSAKDIDNILGIE